MEDFFIKQIVPKTRTSQGGWPADDGHGDDGGGGGGDGVGLNKLFGSAARPFMQNVEGVDAPDELYR